MLLAIEAVLVPTSFVAVTVNEYAVPLSNPEITIEEASSLREKYEENQRVRELSTTQR